MTDMECWTPAQLARFEELTAQGWSASLIGADIGKSRNAVIGKWNRSGISHKARIMRSDGVEHIFKQRRSYKRRRPTTILKPPPKFRFVAPRLRIVSPIAPPVPGSLNPKRLLELEAGDCRFPISPHGSRDFLFCGNPQLERQSYCAGHYWIAHDHTPGRKSQPVRLPPLWCAA
jgi:hypothetical protein